VTEIDAFDVDEATVADLQAAMASGGLTARVLTETYLARIEAADLTLHSILRRTPTRSRSRAMDAERRSARFADRSMGSPCWSRTTSTPPTA
jgi:Asp-tRNA(Asn)/Glu-tRNA(Gln) amidotransferase A subunit family amidase